METLPQLSSPSVRPHRLETRPLSHHVLAVTSFHCNFAGARHLLYVSGDLSRTHVVDRELAELVVDVSAVSDQSLTLTGHPLAVGPLDANLVVMLPENLKFCSLLSIAVRPQRLVVVSSAEDIVRVDTGLENKLTGGLGYHLKVFPQETGLSVGP